MTKKSAESLPSFKKKYIHLVGLLVAFTFLQYIFYCFFYFEDETARYFFESFILVHLSFISILAVELHSLPCHHELKKVSFKQFLSHFIINILAITYLFAAIYNTLYLLDNDSFSAIAVPGFFQPLFDFFCYSIDFVSGGGISDTRPVSFWAKFYSILESLLFLYTVIILLSNFKDAGKSKLGSSIDIISK